MAEVQLFQKVELLGAAKFFTENGRYPVDMVAKWFHTGCYFYEKFNFLEKLNF